MKQKVILLHGALGSAKQFEIIQAGLKDHFEVYLIDFDGHGNGKSTNAMSIELFADNLLNFVEKNDLQDALVFGYSMGGYVALYLQTLHPSLFQSIITLGTKLNWSVESAEKEVQMLNAEKIKEKVPAFASYLENIQAPTIWELMMNQTVELMLQLGNKPLLTSENLNKISIPVTLCLGELDKMVTREETQWAADAINSSSFKLLEDVQHPVQQINSRVIIDLIKSQADSAPSV
ncbi:MAG: alpha/beta hydrolase [Crocinitomicaceae bacterium]|nr:alpha/beta hydrolase [Crocinitomicaceae bacterium]